MTNRATLQVGAALVSGCLLGAMASSLLTGRDQARSQLEQAPLSTTRVEPSDSQAIAKSLTELSDVLAALQTTLEQPAPAPANEAAYEPRRPIENFGEGPGDAEQRVASGDVALLADAIFELSKAIRTMKHERRSVAQLPKAQPPRGERLQILSPLRLPAGAYHDEAIEEAAGVEMRQKHMLWSTEDLIATYGRPNNIWPGSNGTAQWHYKVTFNDGWEEQYDFWVFEDKVTSTNVEYYEPEEAP